jgi:hypothetical protein
MQPGSDVKTILHVRVFVQPPSLRRGPFALSSCHRRGFGLELVIEAFSGSFIFFKAERTGLFALKETSVSSL